MKKYISLAKKAFLSEKWLNIYSIVMILLSLTCVSIIYFNSVLYFNREPWDGSFQTLFPLRNMDKGLYPAIDFSYFHGNGIPYLIYPLYYFSHSVLGLGIIISALNSTFIVNCAFLYLPIYFMMRKISNFSTAVLSTLFISALFDFLPYIGSYFSPLFLGAPMAVRFSPHILLAICFYNLISSYELCDKRQVIKTVLITLFVAAISPLLGAEQGFYAIAAFCLTIFSYLFFYKKKYFNALIYSAFLLILSILAHIAILLVFFQSLESIRAITTISNDQIWVFGVFPNSFFSSFSEVFSLDNINAVVSQLITLTAIIYTIFITFIYRRYNLNSKYFYACLVMFWGGVLSWASNLGYIGAHQAPLEIRYITLSLFPILFLFSMTCEHKK
ncbi:hypothetical protein [Photorhabdus bodei]|uniref:Membrane protein 6-pyruvoyl-tetrahydropterin synthase-related domain-containing protein n=1 Tax=Photorhabdus bodei TaxID=2029681 RepID=A0AAW6BTF2_9GAMM|nr:hypothetical protein [Photorhabdus bodei]MDB6374975.1 hypothetical protein [Photorhabdus bodei]